MVKPKITKLNDVEFADVRQWFDRNLDAEVVDLDDQRVYENVYHDGKFAATFQFTEGGAQRFVERARPRSITDIAAVTSIYRPGPLQAKVDEAYVRDKERVESGEVLTYEHPIIGEVLSKTYGHMCFQEHFMLIGHKLGKLSWDDCDKLRKILVKKSIGTDVNEKKAKDAEAIRQRFMQGAVENGMTPAAVDELWEKMCFFNGYGFNQSFTDSCKLNIYTSDGVFQIQKVVSQITPGDFLVSRDERTGDDIFVEVIALHDHGVLNVFEFEFDDGSKITCTAEHKFRTSDGRMLPIRQILEEGLDVVSVGSFSNVDTSPHASH